MQFGRPISSGGLVRDAVARAFDVQDPLSVRLWRANGAGSIFWLDVKESQDTLHSFQKFAAASAAVEDKTENLCGETVSPDTVFEAGEVAVTHPHLRRRTARFPG
jgi:hypothetical protein